jgi:hypothetical protein
MSVHITSTVKIGIVSGVISVSGPSVSNLSTSNIFDTLNISDSMTTRIGGISEQLLLGSVLIDATKTTVYPVLTVPYTNTLYYISLIEFILMKISGSGTVPYMNVGFTSGINDIINNTALSALTIAGQILPFDNFATIGSNYSSMVGSTILSASAQAISTYTTYSVQCNVYGFSSTF